MVKHIILWKLKAEHNNSMVKENIKKGLESLLVIVSCLAEWVSTLPPKSSANILKRNPSRRIISSAFLPIASRTITDGIL